MSKQPLVIVIPGLDDTPNRVQCLVVNVTTGLASTDVFREVKAFESNGKEGYIAVARKDGAGLGYINGDGQWLLPPTLEDARGFSEDGLARVKVNGLWGYVNRQCEFVVQPQYEDAGPFRGGLAAVQLGKNKWAYMDVHGSIALPGPFAHAKPFSACGLAAAASKARQKVGYINRRGEWAIEPGFTSSLAFGPEGVAPAAADKLYGLIDTQGHWILPPTYSDIREFNDDGLAFFDEVDSWDNGHGYLDAKGHVVIKHDRHLSPYMVKGIVKADYRGARFFNQEGGYVGEEVFSWGEHFSPFGVSICRSRDKSFWRNSTEVYAHPHNRFGLLNTQGVFHLLNDTLIEPLTNPDGWIEGFRHDTPLAPFLTRDGGVAYVSAEGDIVYTLIFSQEDKRLTLLDHRQTVVWQSAPQALQALPQIFFNPEAAQLAEDPRCLDARVVDLAQDMLEGVQQRLDALIAGQRDDEQTQDEEEDEDIDPDVRHVTIRRRVARAYLDENQYSHYEFMSGRHGEVVRELQQRMRQHLVAHFGPADPDPETHAVDRYAEQDLQAWCVPLQTPISRSAQSLPEDNQMWLALYSHSDSGDGDAWHEIWMLAAPSKDALMAAKRLRQNGGTMAAPVDDLRPGLEAESTVPTTYEEWLAVVAQQSSAIQDVPKELLDDALVDAAVAADVEALEYVPPAFQTPARLLALVRKDAYTAAHIPVQCMTLEALTLARQLYEDDNDWCYADQRHALDVNEAWDHNSLYNIWGAHLNEDLCVKAIKADVGLNCIPHWLRTDKIERLAIKKDICNIRYLSPEKITAEMAERAVRETYSNLIQYIPPALQTDALCLKSAKAHGPSLEFIPEHLRTQAVCEAALKQDAAAISHVPANVKGPVLEAMIAHARQRAAEEREEEGEPAVPIEEDGTAWHFDRAWMRLFEQSPADAQGAYDDASMAIPKLRYPAHAHFVRASALRALGRKREAALEAAVVLSMQNPYLPENGDGIDTTWLQEALDDGFSQTDDATLVAEMRSRPLALAHVPRWRITAEMVQAAVAADVDAVQFVPKRLMTPALYLQALKSRHKRFTSIPHHMLSEEICIEWVHDSGWALRDVPLQCRSVAVCAAALKAGSSAQEHVPQAILKQAQAAADAMPGGGPGDGDEPTKQSSWMERKLLKSLTSDTGGNQTLQKLGFFALVVGSVVKSSFVPSKKPATLKGPLAWLERRPVVAMLFNTLLGLLALGLHAWVTGVVWLREGALAGIATGVFVGISELYWAWRFWFQSPTHVVLGLACVVVAFYFLVYTRLNIKVARAIVQANQDDD